MKQTPCTFKVKVREGQSINLICYLTQHLCIGEVRVEIKKRSMACISLRNKTQSRNKRASPGRVRKMSIHMSDRHHNIFGHGRF